MSHDRGHQSYPVSRAEWRLRCAYFTIASINSKRCCPIPSAGNTPLKCGIYLFGRYAKNPTLLYRARQRKGLRVFALGQRLRHFADHVAHSAGVANGERVRRWFQDKKAGWYAVLEDPQMPVTSTLLDQAHNAFERKLFAMKGFHHPGGSQQAFLIGLAHLYNLVPYQRRAQHAGHCGVEVEGGRVPTRDWFLNLQILTSGGFR